MYNEPRRPNRPPRRPTPSSVPVVVLRYLESEPLRAAIAEFERLRDAAIEVSRVSRRLNEGRPQIVKDDRVRLGAVLRVDPTASEKSSKPELPGHDAKIAEAARRYDALALERDGARRRLDRLLAAERPVLAAAMLTDLHARQTAIRERHDELLADLGALGEVWAGLNWVKEDIAKAGEIFVAPSRSNGPQSVPAAIASSRAAVAALHFSGSPGARMPIAADDEDEDEAVVDGTAPAEDEPVGVAV